MARILALALVGGGLELAPDLPLPPKKEATEMAAVVALLPSLPPLPP